MKHRPLPLLVLALVVLVAACGSKTSKLETGGLDQNDAIDHIMTKATRALSSVRNSVTAEEALPELQATAKQLEELGKEADRLSPQARTELSMQAERYLPGWKDNAKRIGAWKGVGEILGPTMVEIVDKLAALR